MRMHCGGALTHWGLHYPSKTACTVDGVTLDYAALNARTDRLCNALMARGIGRGDRVCVLCPNSFELVEALYACLKLGAAVVPLTFLLPPTRLAPMIADAGARIAVVHASYAGRDALAADLRVRSPDTALLAVPLAPDADAAPRPIPRDHIDFCDVFGIIYSSGTTGAPKGIVRSHHAMLAELYVWMVEMKLGFEDTMLLATPLYYTGGLMLILATLFVGGHVVVMSRFGAEPWLDAMQRYRATHAFLVPTQTNRLLVCDALNRADASSLRLIVSMSDAARAEKKLALAERLSCGVIDHWGNSEGIGTLMKVSDLQHKPGSIGKPFLTDEVRVVDEDLNDVPVGQIGQLIGKSDSVFAGYHGRPDLTAQVLIDGWVLSGDLGWRDEDGYFYFVGRSKDILKVGGVTVHPVDIEEVLEQHPDIRAAAVYGRADEDLGERPVGAVIRRGHSASLDEITAWANEQLIRPQRLLELFEHDDFPRTSAGKVVKAELRKRDQERRAAGR